MGKKVGALLAILPCVSLMGLVGNIVQVEVDVAQGIPSFDIVGLPGVAVKESRERVKAAIRNSGFEFPMKRITVNLAPAYIRKEGPVFDLPIALGILIATGQCRELGKDTLVLGELSLDGQVRKIRGALTSVLAARSQCNKAMLPFANYLEASLARDIELIPIKDLQEAVNFRTGEKEQVSLTFSPTFDLADSSSEDIDFNQVQGQEAAKRALEIAAAGNHNILLIGPPGTGKTMLAQRMRTILPPLTHEEIIELTEIYSIAGLLGEDEPFKTCRPFRNPHHTITTAGLMGGGVPLRPGEVSLAHYGILFLDEFPEFSREALEALREPIEEGIVRLSRSQGTYSFPGRFSAVISMNPCPCGFIGDPDKECKCTPWQVQRYMAKVSGPILDRMDLQVGVPRLTYEQLANKQTLESSAFIRERVIKAREKQQQRLKASGKKVNSEMSSKEVREFCRMELQAEALLEKVFHRLHLSGRGLDRLKKVSRTIADLAGREIISSQDLAEAVQYRMVNS